MEFLDSNSAILRYCATALLLMSFMLFPVALCCDSCLHKTKLVYHSQPPLPELISAGKCGYDGSFATDIMSGGKLSVATASAKVYRGGKGCGACYQIRCTDSAVCTKSGVKVVVTDFTEDNRTDFLLYSPTFESLARPGKIDQILNMGAALDVEYKRIPCDYPGKNMSIKVDKSSHYPDYLAVQFLYEGGQTDISLVQVAQVGHWSWREMSLRNNSAVWGIENPSYPLTGQAEPSPLLFRLLVTGGFDGSWVGRPGYNTLPANWKVGSVYDSGLQISERAQEFDCSSCATADWNDNL